MTRAPVTTRTLAPALESATDVRVIGAELYLLPIETRLPLKFGGETLTSVTCARVRIGVRDRQGRVASGWGETPLSMQWAWPSEQLTLDERHDAMVQFSQELAAAWAACEDWGHPLEVGYRFQQRILPVVRQRFNQQRASFAQLPYLAALVCLSAFDIALHDAYGVAHGVPVYQTYQKPWLSHDLTHYFDAAANAEFDFAGRYPADFLSDPIPTKLAAWHLVGGLDLIERSELDGSQVSDSLPVVLDDWIERDGLFCLKVKLRGNDAHWDYDRLVQVSHKAIAHDVKYLSADFNCSVHDPVYVNDMLDRLAEEEPEAFRLLTYVEQPFAYELADQPLDVHSVSARKPLFMDESAHNWQQIRAGRAMGWTGVALKTCKTQTGALLSLCWAKAHQMPVMVQDLTNPMLAQIPHVLLAAHAGTIMGVETNAMQFYPQASTAEAPVHPGIYQRSAGEIDISSITGAGFGYGGAEQARTLPSPVASYGFNRPSVVPQWHSGRT